MKTSSAKQKGRLLQQQVRNKILATFTNLQADDVKSTSMGAQGEDIQLSPAARKCFPFAIECKSRNKVQVYRFMEQAGEHAKANEEPLVVVKENYKDPVAILGLDYFLDLCHDAYQYREHVYKEYQREQSKKAALLRKQQ